ncbi:hypothetical protein O181_039981 [Austropuccinia psidii MF-1]|uniref:N-acetyltransferase domain-containing protein n=1 Tax=Austropuccinia psidii MF-1 TaxID=1389203 RepID=A0A9Q3DAK6_9BASI|nr:hypothetical protein [Austropuccinia psidii MF-1]
MEPYSAMNSIDSVLDRSQSTSSKPSGGPPELWYRAYEPGGDDLDQIVNLIEGELSEPYIIYTYRYFLTSWPHLCFLCFSRTHGQDENSSSEYAVGAVICKQDIHKSTLNRGYIAMLITRRELRKKGIARKLVQLAMAQMINNGAQEIVLETEFDNFAALAFYGKLGFIREKRLFAFYLNRKDAFRLVLPIAPIEEDLYI